MTPSLQELKDRARQVRSDATQIRVDADDKWWAKLITAGALNLGPLWEFVTNGGTKPHGFSDERTTDFAFHISLHGHRVIYAIFRGHDATCAERFWYRSYYYGVNVVDVKDGLGYWMAEPRSETKLMTYHHTLGSAMLAAELV